jgi:uncharacterized protein
MNPGLFAQFVFVSLTLSCAARPGPRPGPPEGAPPVSHAQAAHQHHAIDYIELAVSDVAAAKRFYGAAFGWRFTDYGPDYAGIQGEGREVGGFRKDTEVRTGGPLVVLYSDSLEATLAALRDAGGRISREIFSFPGGRRFHFTDPSGNELAVWSAR